MKNQDEIIETIIENVEILKDAIEYKFGMSIDEIIQEMEEEKEKKERKKDGKSTKPRRFEE